MIRSLRRSLSASFCGALLVGGIASDAFGQDGKLISAVSVTPRDEDVKRLEKGQPDIRAILDRVEIKSIAYLSDELKVRGYLVTPKTGERRFYGAALVLPLGSDEQRTTAAGSHIRAERSGPGCPTARSADRLDAGRSA